MKQLLIATLILATAFGIQAQDKTINRTFKNIKSIRLNTSSGDITFKKSNGPDVTLALTYSYDDNAFKPLIEESNGTLTLKEDFSRGNHSGQSSWVLTIPDKTKVGINTGSGNVSMTGFQADVKSNLGSGNVEITDVKGNVDFNTGSGNIVVNNAEGEIALNTGSGDIRANEGSGKLSFNAGSGNIRLEKIKGNLSMNTGSGDIQAENIIVSGVSKFNSGSGNASVSLAGSPDFDISVNSGSGDATVDFNGAPISGEIIMTANEKNGDIVAPFGFDKEETIEDGHSSRIRKTARLGTKNITIKIGTGSGTAAIAK
jgi:hypothetical protein